MHDRALVDAVLAGDRDVYRLLVERESGAVIGVCLRVLGDPDEAQDAAQDAFVRAYRSLAGYRGDGTFGAWVGRIARRIAVARAAGAGPWSLETFNPEYWSRDPTQVAGEGFAVTQRLLERAGDAAPN